MTGFRQIIIKPIIVIVLTVCLGFGHQVLAQPPSHDPSTMIKGDDGRYWIFTTGSGIWCMASATSSFSSWQAETTPFAPGTWPQWINSAVPGFDGSFWAPDVIYMNGYYCVFYSVSSWGSSRSAIGMVRTPSLKNPVWEDMGKVASSNGTSSAINAIDPALLRDSDGKVWMTYGSWFGGIGITEIDTVTGKAVGNLLHLMGGNHQSMEAPYLLKNNGYYYLFVNHGTCCAGVSSTYYVSVSRSTKITGPYVSERQFLANSNGNIIGPGHVGYAEGKLTYHYYSKSQNGAAKLYITTMGYENDWPKAGITGGHVSPTVNMEADAENSFYPNPSNGNITLELSSEPAKIFVANIDGRMVFEKSIAAPNSTENLHTGLRPGVYSITVIQEQKRHTQTLLIQ